MNKKLFLSVLVIITIASISAVVFAGTLNIRPNGQGNYSGWTNVGCGSGSSEWQCVDEPTANTSDYLYSSSNSIKESFGFENLWFSTGIINSVTLYYYAMRYSSSKYNMQPLIRSSGTDYLGSQMTTKSSYAYYQQKYTTNPATGNPWTIAEVNALEAGMGTSSLKGGAYVAQVYANVNYTIPDSCSDTDGGNVTAVFGITSGYLYEGYYTHVDVCMDSSIISEHYCIGNYEYIQNQSCGEDYYVGSNYCMNGDVYRNYTDSACGSGVCSYNITPTLMQNCTSGQYCSSGQCLWEDSCSDTDGGNVPAIFGDVTGYLDQSYYDYSDYCVDNESIKEYFCNGAYNQSQQQSCGTDEYVGSNYCMGGDVYRNYTDYYCGSGICDSSTSAILQQDCVSGQYCSDGECNWNNSCSDTDGGFVVTALGNVSGYYNSQYYNEMDVCNNVTTILEFYCSGNYAYNLTESCITNSTTSCSNGVCV